jgi:DNA ligase-1
LGTGFGEEMLESLTKSCNEVLIEKPLKYVKYPTDPKLVPDVYFQPKLVWEVLCADLSLSPVYLAAMGQSHPEKGIALRFPRFIRVRLDKNAEDATSAQQVSEMYENQENRK